MLAPRTLQPVSVGVIGSSSTSCLGGGGVVFLHFRGSAYLQCSAMHTSFAIVLHEFAELFIFYILLFILDILNES